MSRPSSHSTKPLLALLPLLLLAGGCGDEMMMPPDAGSPDLAVGPDLGAAGQIGAACKSASECAEGKSPTCLMTATYPKGYCSSDCSSDADCGSGVCTGLGGGKTACLQACTKPSDCRTADRYACWTDGTCFSSAGFDCDPAAGDGRCTTLDGVAGGCIRWALGTGNKGYCSESCVVGTGTCPPDGNGDPQHCVIVDNRYDTDFDDLPLGDQFVGGLCYSLVPDATANDAECTYSDGAGGTTHYYDVCGDGYQCYLKGTDPAGMGYDANGSNLCRQLCYLASGPDGGTAIDGGMVAADCPGGMHCKSIWGIEVGLCVSDVSNN